MAARKKDSAHGGGRGQGRGAGPSAPTKGASTYGNIEDPMTKARLSQDTGSNFQAPLWSQWFQFYSERAKQAARKDQQGAHKPPQIREMRQVVQEGTLKALMDGGYDTLVNGEIRRVELHNAEEMEALAQSNEWYDFAVGDIRPVGECPHYETTVQVRNMDCLAAGVAMRERGLNPMILNNASARRPGGGYRGGAGAQEESIFRRTTCPVALDSEVYMPLTPRVWAYPHPEFGGIYSPAIKIFRGTESEGYPFLEAPVTCGFVAAAAYVRPPLDKNGRMSDEIEAGTLRKIRGILKIGADHGHDALVLGAFGCGAFGNSPDHMVELFAKAVDEYRGWFREIDFAIIEDHNSGRNHNKRGNVVVFQERFRS